MYKVLILMFFSFQVVASDIFLTWDIPTGREDGSTIQTIDRFNIYQTFNNGGTVIVEIDPASNSHQISNVEAGIYTFQISTVETGQEGALSDPISINVTQSKPVKIMLTVELVE